MRWARAYLGAGLAIAALDAVWLTFAADALYRPNLPGLMMPEGFRLMPAVIFYLVYILGVVVFAVGPGVRNGRWTSAWTHGALLGFVCYATYDLTNQATLNVWSTTVTVADLAWGTFLTAVGASAGYFAGRSGQPVILSSPLAPALAQRGDAPDISR